MKTVNIIYHRKDLDGFCSGAIARMAFENHQVTMTGWDYNDPVLPDSSFDYDQVVVVDLSLPINQMLQFKDRMIWIDHHRSAILDSKKYEYNLIKGIRLEGDSASLFCWRYFNDILPVPPVLYWVDRYDVWKQEETFPLTGAPPNDDRSFDRVIWVQNLLRVYFEDPAEEHAFNHWKYFLSDRMHHPDGVYFKEGQLINKMIVDQESKIAKNHFIIPSWNGYSWTAVNGSGGSKVLKCIDTSKTDGIMMFRFNGEKWIFSLYGNGEVDCSVIAKSLQGGGHFSASGFSLTNEQFVEFINETLIK